MTGYSCDYKKGDEPMPDLSPETIYRVFRDLLDEAPASLRPEIEALLARAEAGKKTDNQLLRLARRDRDFLQRVNACLDMFDDTRGFSRLAGSFGSTPGLTYVCPQCDYSRTLGEVGEEPGECPTHHVALIPQAQKGR
jgi:hypothetical protein